jgi:hypothetical protein
MSKTEVESWEQLVAEEMAAAEIVELDDALVDDFGITYEAWEELAFGEAKELERDMHRWELDPASAEDYCERNRCWKAGPALKWRHFGH